MGVKMLGLQGRSDESVMRADPPSDAIRWAVMALLLVAAVAHMPVVPEHLVEAPYMGVLFIGFTLAAFGLATVIAASPSAAWYFMAGVLCGSAVGAYVATRLVAFPQLADDVGLWMEPLGLVSISTETAAVALSLLALRSQRSHTTA